MIVNYNRTVVTAVNYDGKTFLEHATNLVSAPKNSLFEVVESCLVLSRVGPEVVLELGRDGLPQVGRVPEEEKDAVAFRGGSRTQRGVVHFLVLTV